jgi:plasmid stabilization system protein ParE
MAATVIWAHAALDDITAIADYIGHDSPSHARRVVDALFELGDSLVDHPRAGRIVPELNNERVRERFLYSYRLLYEIGTERISILAVIHGARLLESLGQRFER